MSVQEQYKQQQRELWGKAAEFWGRWHRQFSEMSREVTEALVAAADLAPGMRVLDLASGSGEPCLTVARIVGEGGSVVASDLAPEMVAVLQENVRSAGLRNVTCREIDAEAIPFPDASFDRVTCRFGVMFFPDVPEGLREIRRVLKPGGRAALTAWAPPELNPFFSVANGILREHGLLTPPPPDAPNVFRFAEPGSISAAMRSVGFRDVWEAQQPVPWRWPGSLDEFWTWWNQGTPARAAVEAAEPAKREQVYGQVRGAFARFEKDGGLAFGGAIVLATAAR